MLNHRQADKSTDTHSWPDPSTSSVLPLTFPHRFPCRFCCCYAISSGKKSVREHGELLANSSFKLLLLHPCFLFSFPQSTILQEIMNLYKLSEEISDPNLKKGLFFYFWASVFKPNRVVHSIGCKNANSQGRSHINSTVCVAFLKIDFKHSASALMTHKLLFDFSAREFSCSRLS